jgi:catechol 2,3-dioxygenase-like lactoylglutathione lyase family enzyme
MRLEQIDHVALRCASPEATKAWYVSRLGFEHVFPGQWSGIPIMLHLGSTFIALFPRKENEWTSTEGRAWHLAFRAATYADFKSAQTELQEGAVSFQFRDHEIAHSIYFHDPDGLLLEITTYDLQNGKSSSTSYPTGTEKDACRETRTEISSVSPFFIVKDCAKSLSFYRDRLGFNVTFQEPAQNPFFVIVCRGGAMIMLKTVGLDPLPNHKREPAARWDAYFAVSDPDALAAEFASRNIQFSKPLDDTHDGLRGFEIKDADGYVLFFGRPRA